MIFLYNPDMNISSRVLVMACLLTMSAVSVLPAQVRTWSDRSGTTLQAEYVSVAGQFVWLRKGDGAKFKVPFNKLSDHDQDWIADVLKYENTSLAQMGLTHSRDLPSGTSASPAPAAPAPTVEPGVPPTSSGDFSLDTGYKDTYGLPGQQQNASPPPGQPAESTAASDSSSGPQKIDMKKMVLPAAVAGGILLVIIIAVAAGGSRKKKRS
jgi:hypothetical protein